MSSIASIFVSPFLLTVLLISIHVSQGQLNLLPDADFLNFIPDACRPNLNNIVLPCALTNSCFTVIPSEEELASIPDESEIGSCADVETPLCPISTRCTQCLAEINDFFLCVILTNDEAGTISQNITDLIVECPLDCSSTVDAAPVDPTTEAPMDPTDPPSPLPGVETSAPTEAPAPDSLAPSDVPGATEATEAPDDSGAMNSMVSTQIMAGVLAAFVFLSSMTL